MRHAAAIAFAISTTAAGLALSQPAAASSWAGQLDVDLLTEAPYPGRIDVQPETGDIALGRVGPGSGTWYRVRTIRPGVSDAIEWGWRTQPDPDSVAWDVEGRIGPAGSILVGGVHGIWAVSEDGSITRAMESNGTWLTNPEDIAFDDRGNLIVADFGSRGLWRYDPEADTAELLHEFAGGILQFDIASDGSFVVVDPEFGLRIISESGDDQGTVGNARYMGVAAGRGLVWSDAMYAVEMHTGDLVRIEADGDIDTVFAGVIEPVLVPANVIVPPEVELALTPTNELLIAVTETGEIFRVGEGVCGRMDTNQNGFITAADFAIWVLLFNRRDMRADVDGDGTLLPADFYAWIRGWHACPRSRGISARR